MSASISASTLQNGTSAAFASTRLCRVRRLAGPAPCSFLVSSRSSRTGHRLPSSAPCLSRSLCGATSDRAAWRLVSLRQSTAGSSDEPQLLVVEDARQDARFDRNPNVCGGPQMRFYAGAPLVTPSGVPIGAPCEAITTLGRRTATATGPTNELTRSRRDFLCPQGRSASWTRSRGRSRHLSRSCFESCPGRLSGRWSCACGTSLCTRRDTVPP